MAARVTPNVACLWRCWFRQVSELPRRISPSPATPVMMDSGRPLSCISGFTGDGPSSRPDARIIRAVPTYQSSSFPKSQPFGIADDSLSELPRTLNPPAPTDGYPSHLGSRTIRFALVRYPSCPGHLPSATAIDQFPGCPKSWVSHRSSIHRASSFPESWILG